MDDSSTQTAISEQGGGSSRTPRDVSGASLPVEEDVQSHGSLPAHLQYEKLDTEMDMSPMPQQRIAEGRRRMGLIVDFENTHEHSASFRSHLSAASRESEEGRSKEARTVPERSPQTPPPLLTISTTPPPSGGSSAEVCFR